MNFTTQECTNCSTPAKRTLNLNNDAGWVRLFGAHHGAPTLTQAAVAQPNSITATVLNSAAIDLCPACVATFNLAPLLALTAKVMPAPVATPAATVAAK